MTMTPEQEIADLGPLSLDDLGSRTLGREQEHLPGATRVPGGSISASVRVSCPCCHCT